MSNLAPTMEERPAPGRLLPKGRMASMFDEMDTLRASLDLQRLLDHYVAVCLPDRECWQDRRMEMEGVEAPDLVKLHGLLIAFGWLEQNVGHVPVLRASA